MLQLHKFVMALAALVVAQVARADVPPADTEGPPIEFVAELSADEESAVTESSGRGRVEFSLDRKTLRFSWKGSFTGLTSAPIRIAIHGPQTPGGEAAALIDMSPGGAKSPFQGAHVLNDGELEYLTSDRLYVNLTTVKYKNGELRSPIRRVRPKAPVS